MDTAFITITRTQLQEGMKTVSAGRARRRKRTDETVQIVCNGHDAALRRGGASVRLDAQVTGVFQVNLPLWLFKQLLAPRAARGAFTLAFGPGWLRDGGVMQRDPAIDFSTGVGTRPPEPAAAPATAKATDGDLALEDATAGRIYNHFRHAPSGTTPGTPQLVRLYADALARVRRAEVALRTLDITREDIDEMIRRKFGPW